MIFPICDLLKRLCTSYIPRGCGGWCSGHKELCRYVGANTYQCVDDSGIRITFCMLELHKNYILYVRKVKVA